jgi:hypothetical protein
VPIADHPFWTDYVAALGGVIGLVIALIGLLVAGGALYYAIQSAADAE